MKTIIQTITRDLEASRQFYKRLNFTPVDSSDKIIYSAGKILIHINEDKLARMSIQLLKSNWQSEVTELEKITKVIKVEDGFLLADPSGTWISLIETNDDMKPQNSATSSSVLGNYAGISLETMDIKLSQSIWEAMGFHLECGDESQGWMSLVNDEQSTISLMSPNICPHVFYNPSLTFFNGAKNVGIIEKIRDLGISITEEITAFNQEGIVDNIVIQDPSGLGFFIFSDG